MCVPSLNGQGTQTVLMNLSNKVDKALFSSNAKRRKLQAFRTQLKHANANQPVEDEILFEFLKHFHLLGYDLDVKAGVSLSFIHSLIHQYSRENVQNLWARLVDEVMSANQNAGTISRDSLPEDLQDAFKQRVHESHSGKVCTCSAENRRTRLESISARQ